MNILWLKTELLHPLDKGGRIRTYHMLRELKREHRIMYLTLDDGDAASDAVDRATEYCDTLERIPFKTERRGSLGFYHDLARNLRSPLPYAIWKYRSPAMQQRIAEIARERSVDLVVCDFLAPAVNVPASLPVPVVLFQHNVEALIWQRHAALARGALRASYLRQQWLRMSAFERAQCRRFDHVIAVSPDDLQWFRTDYRLSKVSDVPTGVDTEYFRPSHDRAAEPHELLFTGSMDWMPNADAVTHFAEEILPLVQREVPTATLKIVGRRPTAAVRALAARHAAIDVIGTVPDVRPYHERAAVFVVPLRIGGGTRLKIFEAMAMEKAVVSTTVGAEGLDVGDGEHLLLADTPAGFAAAVVRLLRDPVEAAALGQRAAAHVRARFGWKHVASQFADICAGVVDTSARGDPVYTSRQ